jgi:hypothetical protein
VALFLALAVVLAGWTAAAAMRPVRSQDAATAPVEVGAGPVGEPALRLVGRTLYRPDSVEVFGYVTAVIGLDDTLLFTAAPPAVQTARFTYAGDIAIDSVADRGDVTEIAGTGVMRIYLDDDAGASWDDAASFADGEPVAEFSILLRDTLQRQAPGVGVVIGDEQLAQAVAGEFSFAGETYRFGNVGIAQRLRSVGALIGAADDRQPVAVSLTATAAVTARETNPVRLGASAP